MSASYRPAIDGLRALAVVAVVVYHVDPGLLPGGFVGVDVFFVISGYLITALLVREHATAGRIDFAAFYARRCRRLLPALIVLVVAVMVLLLVVAGRHVTLLRATGESAVWSLAFLANVHFEAVTTSYFEDVGGTLPLLHLWSLGVEEQFYFVWPAVLALLLRFVPGGVRSRLIVLAVFSFALAEYWVHIEAAKAFYRMPARFWELAAGGLVALSAVPSTSGRREQAMLAAGLMAVVAACVWTSRLGPFPASSALPVVAGSALVLLAIHRGGDTGPIARLLTSRAVVGIGLVSYSLYLWHWPLLVLADRVAFDPAPVQWRWALMVVALVVAWASWRFVETPWRRPASPRRALLAAAVALAVTMPAVTVLATLDRVPVDVARRAAAAARDFPADMARCHFEIGEATTALKGPECWSDSAREPKMLVWGDSHALAWKPFVWRLADREGVSAAAATRNSCRPSATPPAAAAGHSERACATMNALVLDWIAEGELDTVVLGLSWPWALRPGEPVSEALRAHVDGIDAVLERLPASTRVIVFGPPSRPRRAVPECIARGWEARCAVTRAEHDISVANTWRELEAFARRHPNVTLIDPTDWFCDATTCPVIRHGVALFRDDNHVAATAARGFADAWLADPARYTRLPGAAPTGR